MKRAHGGTGGQRVSPGRVTLNRRRLLQAAGTLALGTTVAGCLGRFEGSESVGERPAYSRWIGSEHLDTATEERDGFLFVRTGFRELRELEESEDAFEGFDSGTADDEPYELVVAPLWGTIAFMFVASLGLISYGNAAGQVMGAMRAGMGASGPETETESESPHTIDSGVLAGRLVVFEGDFDVEALDEAVEAFEATEEYGDFQIYEGTEGSGSMLDTRDLAFAASGDAVLFPFSASDVEETEALGALESTEILKSHVDVAAGDAEEAADGDEGFDWALRAGGDRAFVLGGHGMDEAEVDAGSESFSEEPELDTLDPLVEGAQSFALSMAWNVEEGTILADAGFSYPEEAARPEETAFEDLVDGATSSSVTVDGARARVEAEWAGDGTGTSSS